MVHMCHHALSYGRLRYAALSFDQDTSLRQIQRVLAPVALCASLVLAGCGGSASTSNTDATIAAYQTQVSELQEENNLLSTVVAENSLTPNNSTSQDVSKSPNTAQAIEIGDGTIVTYRGWQMEFTGYSVSDSIDFPSEEYFGFVPDDQFHIIEVRVENTSQLSAPFPRSEFVVTEQYGAEFRGSRFPSSDPLVDDEKNLIPGNVYDIWLVFDVPNEATGLTLSSNDGGVVVDLGSYDPSATPIPNSVSVVSDGTSVTYEDWTITFEGISWLRGSQNDDYLDVEITVTNGGSQSQTFPFKDFEISEQYGSTFSPFTLDFPETGDMLDDYIDAEDEMLLPNKPYELVLEFAVSKGSEGLVLRSLDGSLLVMLDGD
jgi:hypothetical protein